MSAPQTVREQIDALPGAKEDELGGLCAFCTRPIVRPDYPPLFFRLKLERLCLDAQAVRRRQGLAMLLGSHPLARVMGPNEDIAKVITGPRDVFIYEPCIMEHAPMLMVALEQEPLETPS